MKPYYAPEIDETIYSDDEDRLYRAMMDRTIDQLEKYAAELDIRGMSDQHLRNTRLYKFAQKCIEARRKQLKEIEEIRVMLEDEEPQHSNSHRVSQLPQQSQPFFNLDGFWNPLTAVMSTIAAWHVGAVVGEKMAEWSGMAVDQDEIDRLLGK